MKKYCLVILFTLLFFGVKDGAAAFDNPVIDASNPYYRIAKSAADYDIAQAKSGADTAPVWLAWAYCAPEGHKRGNDEVRGYLENSMDRVFAGLEAAPEVYWILDHYEALYFMIQDPAHQIEQEKIEKWKRQLQPSAQLAYMSLSETGEAWMSRAPNTLHQGAAVLEIAGKIFHKPEYSVLAASLVEGTGKNYQSADGAFAYIKNSTTAPMYYRFDASFLGRYYMLSGNETAKNMLIKMASYSKFLCANGAAEASSSPWWKKNWNEQTGPGYAYEIIAGIAKDPLSRAAAEKRRASMGQRYFYTYYAMCCYDPQVPVGNLETDLTAYNDNIGGPQLRRGAFQAVMPQKAYTDTSIGITVTANQGLSFDTYLECAALAVYGKGAGAWDNTSSIISGNDDAGNGAYIVGDGWIISARNFIMRHAYTGSSGADPVNTDKGWRSTQIWFAEQNSFCGMMKTKAARTTAVSDGPGALIKVNRIDRLDANRFSSGKMKYEISSGRFSQIYEAEEGKQIRADFSGAGTRVYQAGETFSYTLTGAMEGYRMPASGVKSDKNGLEAMKIIRGNGQRLCMYYNPTGQSCLMENVKEVEKIYASEGAVERIEDKLFLKPYGLVACAMGEEKLYAKTSRYPGGSRITVYNDTAEEKHAEIVLGVYASDGTLIEIKKESDTVPAFGYVEKELPVNAPGDIKLFCWESLETMKPVMTEGV